MPLTGAVHAEAAVHWPQRTIVLAVRYARCRRHAGANVPRSGLIPNHKILAGPGQLFCCEIHAVFDADAFSAHQIRSPLPIAHGKLPPVLG